MAEVKGPPERPVSPACDSRSGEGRLCMCKVCTCGFHKCPQKHTSVHTKFGDKTISEYTAKYPEWPMLKKFQRKPELTTNNNAQIASNTTYTDDFVKHPFGPAASCRPNPKMDRTGVFQKETTYTVDYWDKSKNMQTRRIMPPQTQQGGGKFSGETTYTVDFKDCGPQPKPTITIHGCSLGSTGAKFDSDTTYHDDYRECKMPKRYQHIQRDNPQTAGKIQGPTTYQADFQGQAIPGKCPVLARGKPSVICGDHMCY